MKKDNITLGYGENEKRGLFVQLDFDKKLSNTNRVYVKSKKDQKILVSKLQLLLGWEFV